MYLADSSGSQVAAYLYDPYGKVLSSSGTMAEINPLRYRGYYQDSETGFYYLQSRYYDPAICRFINADSYASTGQGLIGYNAFAYCTNAPISMADYSGDIAISASCAIVYILAVVCVSGIIWIGSRPEVQQAFGNAVNSVISILVPEVPKFRDDVSVIIHTTSAKQQIAAKMDQSFAKAKAREYRTSGEWHHMVAKGAPNAQRAAQVLKSVGLDVNSDENLIYLKTSVHRRIHTNIYYGWANSLVISAYNSAAGNHDLQYSNVRSALGVIRTYLEALAATAPW